MTSQRNDSARADSALCQVPKEDVQMLASMRQCLADYVAPELRSELGRTTCDFTIQFLDRLLTKHTQWPAIFRRQIERQSQALLECADFLLEHGSMDATHHEKTVGGIDRLMPSQHATLAELDQAHRRLNESLEVVMPLLVSGNRDDRSLDSQARRSELLRALVRSVRDAEEEFNAASQRRAAAYEAKAHEHAALTHETFQTYLRERFPERPGIEVTSFRELPGGSSKSTILVDVRGLESDKMTSLVVRLDRKAGSTDTRVLNEVAALQTLFRQGLPVPEVLWIESNPAALGFAFIVVRKVEGELGGGLWQPDVRLCDAGTARDLARVLAKLHALDPIALELEGALRLPDRGHPMLALIGNIRQLWTDRKLEPDGVLETCLSWLENNLPPEPAKKSLVHGDVSFHNFIVKDRRIAALLDWELSHLGDPIEDLSYSRMAVEQLLPWEDFLAEYRRHGGCEYSEEIGLYYGVWRGVRNAVYTLTCRHSFHTDANLDLRWGFFASNYRMVLLEAADRIAQAGAGPASYAPRFSGH